MQTLDKQAPVAVIGAGAMGAGIAQVAAAYGHPVKLYDVAPEAVGKALDGLGKGLDKQVSRGKISADDAQSILQRIAPVAELSELADAALVIEAVVERLDIKQQIFAELENLCAPDVILASNTSSLSITALGAVLKRPERLAGMHFFNPPQAMKLVEVISGLATDDAVVDKLLATAGAWGKKPVRTRSTPGFIVNRVARPFYAEALRLLQDGAGSCRTIDEVMSACAGFRMGPFSLMDLIGLDVNYAVTESVFEAYYQDPRFKPSIIQREMVNGGYLGRKSGRGFYRYDEDLPVADYCADFAPQRAVTVTGKPDGIDAIIRCCEQQGLVVQHSGADHGAYLTVNNTRVAVTDGRTASELSRADGYNNWVLMDLVADIDTSPAVALACSDLADEQALADIGGFLQALGKRVLVVDDTPGMVAMRTVCMLANEAADAVKEGVCDAAAVDQAMQLGTNYPRGPLAWAEAIGLQRVLHVIEQLHRWYGEDRYRSSALLRRLVISGGRFHD